MLGSDSEGRNPSGTNPAQPSQMGTQEVSAPRPRVNRFANRARVSLPSNHMGAALLPAGSSHGHEQHGGAGETDVQGTGRAAHVDEVPCDDVADALYLTPAAAASADNGTAAAMEGDED
eukprot:9468317-Pyramimonas_sp.AAC.1